MTVKEELLNKIREAVVKTNEGLVALGDIAAAEMRVAAAKSQAYEQLTEWAKVRESLVKELEEEYGSGDLNLETGEFVPHEDVPTEE